MAAPPEAKVFAAAEAAGLRSMREDGERLVAEGITSLEEVVRVDARVAAPVDRVPAYRFEALDAAGKAHQRPRRRRQLAGRARAAARPARWCRWAVTRWPRQARRQVGFSFTRRVFNATGLAVWTRQLAGLVGAGLPLERALTALADEAEEQRQRELVAHLRSEVNGGAPFARALASVPREFDDVYRGVVAAGEQSGALGRVLERLADDLEERQALKGKLIGATLYPAIVSVIAVVIVVFLVTYVVPQVASVFTSSKRALPLPHRWYAGHQRFPARLGLAAAAAARRRWRAFSPAACATRPSACASTPACSGCRWSAASRAATTPPASPARWPCSPAPACRS